MLFRRKNPAGLLEKFKIAVWPRRSWARSTKYLAKRVLRLTGSPHAIAAGIAAGVFASFTPYLGLHFIIAFAVAYVIAGNFIAAATGTFFGNPLTFPFIWGGTYSVGNFILTGSFKSSGGSHLLKDVAHTSFWDLGMSGVWKIALDIWEPLLKPMTIGAIPLGLLFGIVFYIITRTAAVAFQIKRRSKLAEKARELKERSMSRFKKQSQESS